MDCSLIRVFGCCSVFTKSNNYITKRKKIYAHFDRKYHIYLFRVAIRTVFPGHVLFFRVKNSVRRDFLNVANRLSLFPINSMLL